MVFQPECFTAFHHQKLTNTFWMNEESNGDVHTSSIWTSSTRLSFFDSFPTIIFTIYYPCSILNIMTICKPLTKSTGTIKTCYIISIVIASLLLSSLQLLLLLVSESRISWLDCDWFFLTPKIVDFRPSPYIFFHSFLSQVIHLNFSWISLGNPHPLFNADKNFQLNCTVQILWKK